MSKETILAAIRKSKPPAEPLPELDLARFERKVPVPDEFVLSVEAAAGRVQRVETVGEITAVLKGQFPDAKTIISEVDGIDIGSTEPVAITKAAELDSLDLAVVAGQLGVAENGAVWVSDRNFSHRIIPFITSHLVIVLESQDIVENMHDAYQRLNGCNEGFGVFIAGPSKTADIEQTLVIGAHGPLSLTVFLI